MSESGIWSGSRGVGERGRRVGRMRKEGGGNRRMKVYRSGRESRERYSGQRSQSMHEEVLVGESV